jgi:ATP-dependent HslUV protease ATP-binding subunit HslU
MNELTPKQIVTELDRYIVGQEKAKRSVAIALRNRWRRQRVGDGMRTEIVPNNIIMIGQTGVGKTEIARRLAGLTNAPFIKVEASKFTEVGYVGRDVESIIRDLVDLGVNMVRAEYVDAVEAEVAIKVEERLLDLLSDATKGKAKRRRDQLRRQLRSGKLDQQSVQIEVPKDRTPMVEVFSAAGNLEEMSLNLQEMLSEMTPPARKERYVSLADARHLLTQEETQKQIDRDQVVAEAIDRVTNAGIVFLDEIDKIAGEPAKTGPDISREGVQRDLLPIIEGCTVATKYGMVRTDHILFVAAGAFHTSKPSDMIPELQGRFPIRVELDTLEQADFVRILDKPKNALIKQYTALLATDGVELTFDAAAVREIARIAFEINQQMENIGARRLHTVMSTLLDQILFDAPGARKKTLRISKSYVVKKLKDVLEDEDLSRYVL